MENFHHQHFNNSIDQSSAEKLDKRVLKSTGSNRNDSNKSNKNRGRKLTIESLSMRQKKNQNDP